MPIKTIIKISFSLLMLAILFHEIHLNEVLPYLKKMDYVFFSAAILVLLAGNLVAAFRWITIMKTLGAPDANHFYYRTYFTGLTFNQVLPSSIGGDGFRMLEIRKLGIKTRDAITSVLADRIFGFTGLVIMSSACLLQAFHILPKTYFLMMTILLSACACGILSVYFLRTIQIPILQKYLSWFYALSQTIRGAFSSTTDLLNKLFLGIITNASSILSFYFLARAMHIPVSLIDFMLIIPMVSLIMMIPISMAGWGIREGAMVVLGGLIGISHPAALAISLLNGFILIVNSMPGFYFFLTKKEKMTIQTPVTP